MTDNSHLLADDQPSLVPNDVNQQPTGSVMHEIDVFVPHLGNHRGREFDRAGRLCLGRSERANGHRRFQHRRRGGRQLKDTTERNQHECKRCRFHHHLGQTFANPIM
jgi:hypothetical protein